MGTDYSLICWTCRESEDLTRYPYWYEHIPITITGTDPEQSEWWELLDEREKAFVRKHLSPLHDLSIETEYAEYIINEMNEKDYQQYMAARAVERAK